METKNIRNLTVKHFGFLQESYGFKYNELSHCYVRPELEIEVQHTSGALNVFFVSKSKMKSLAEVVSELLNKEFTYPAYFSSLVFSMGDVDSRLAYDAKLMKEYATDIL
jgi:uncharacterized phosphosugar-binding protein